MKKLALVCLVSCLTFQACAQQNTLDKNSDAFALQNAIKKKKTGIALTVAGSGLLVVGLVVASNSSVTTTSVSGGPTQTTTEGNPGLAAVTLLLSAGLLGTGIPLWAVGSHREKKLKNPQGVSLSVTPQANGLTLRLRF